MGIHLFPNGHVLHSVHVGQGYRLLPTGSAAQNLSCCQLAKALFQGS